MAMKTIVQKNGESLIVKLAGQLDFETTDHFRLHLAQIERQAKSTNPDAIVFDFEDLQFVGSSGISAFIQALREFNSRAPKKPSYTNVRSEFRKMIIAFDESGTFEFVESGAANGRSKLTTFDN